MKDQPIHCWEFKLHVLLFTFLTAANIVIMITVWMEMTNAYKFCTIIKFTLINSLTQTGGLGSGGDIHHRVSNNVIDVSLSS